MKIAILTHYFDPHIGGIEIVAKTHATRLAARGHDVTVITTDIETDRVSESRDGYEIRRYSAINPLEKRGVPYPVPDPINCARVVRSTLDESFDVLHVHGLNYLTSLLPLVVARMQDPVVVVHQHTPFVDYSAFINPLERLNDNLVGRLVLRQADHCIAVSENIAEYASSLGAKSVSTIYNGVDTDRFSPDTASSQNEFLYLGRLTQKKGIERFLEAIQLLDERGTDAVVRIAGRGEMAGTIEEMASSIENLEYEGFVSPEDLPELYARSRALVVPKQDGDAFPTLTILEALASGTPPILVKRNINAPGFTENETYVLSEPTPESLADAISDLSEDSGFAEEMAKNSRKAAVGNYDWPSRIDELEATYRRLL